MSDRELPIGWISQPLEKVAEVQLGKMLDKSKNAGELRPYLRNINVRWFSFELDDIAQMRMSDAEVEKFSIRDGDLLVCEGGEPGRCSVWSGGKTNLTYQKALHRVRVSRALHPLLLAWQLRLDSLTAALAKHLSGSTIKHLPQVALQRYEVRVPPLAEQQRIADKLDTVLARVDACRDRLARVTPLLKRFRQSVLAAATAGRLTEDLNSTGERAWNTVTLESLCSSVSDGPFGSHLKSDDYVEQGARVVRLENIGHLAFVSSKQTFISLEKYATLERHKLAEGDLLFSSFVDEEVRVCRFPGDLGSFAINKADCFCLRVNTNACDPSFLMYRLACKTTYVSLKEQVHGATRPRINLGQLRRFELSLPSLAEQEEIVRRVEILFAFADRLEARLAQAQTAVDRLTPSLLAKAFRGELVPQDPADEPAAELLKRLQSSAAEKPAAARPRRRAAAASP